MRPFYKLADLLEAIPYALIALFLRIIVARPFFVSGQTKVEGPTIGREVFGVDLSMTLPTSLRDSAVDLFADEYKLPFISPEHAAHLTAGLEFLLPVLLVLGLLARLSASGLLAITIVIQLFVYPDAWWSAHAYWAALLLVLIARGAGGISLDSLMFRRGKSAA
ncbi:MAG: DoxX family protein [Methylocystis sp.]|nr:MAG: DoxX family protein [Methylocystis sp.]